MVRATGRVYYSGKLFGAYRKAVTRIFEEMRPAEPFTGSCAVRIAFCGARKGSDPDNLAKAVMDFLVSSGILADDNGQIVRFLGIESYEKHPEYGAGLCVEVRELPKWFAVPSFGLVARLPVEGQEP